MNDTTHAQPETSSGEEANDEGIRCQSVWESEQC